MKQVLKQERLPFSRNVVAGGVIDVDLAGNKSVDLNNAKKRKDDEYYTQYDDVAEGLAEFEARLCGKVVYCNCDNPFVSQFVCFFLDHFDRLGLKRLLATNYVEAYERGLFDDEREAEPAWVLDMPVGEKTFRGLSLR